ncbi:MAG: hypothetical protein HAW63_00025 [Bdellovibrionaceae bacterium]|nr:hypothetical protein [Pseudobdellovibrionaceae bacterium]
MIVKLVFFVTIIVFFSSLKTGNHYLCYNKGKDKAISFSWSKYDVRVGRMSFSRGAHFVNKNYKKNLTSSMKGGTYNVTATPNKVELNYIQNFVKTKIKHPSGKLTTDTSLIKSVKAFKKVRRYHALFAGVVNYSFDIQKKNLVTSLHKLYPPRKVTKQRFELKKGDKRSTVITLGLVSKKEFQSIFFKNKEKPKQHLYPNCHQESWLINQLRYLMAIFTFA